MSDERDLLRELQGVLEAADVDVASLVEGAWEQAYADVQATLHRLMTRDLLTRSLATLQGPQAAPVSAPPPSPGPTPAEAPEPERRDPTPPNLTPPDLTPPDPTPPASEGRDPRPPGAETATYLFGIVGPAATIPSEPLPPLPGGGPVRLVEVGRVRGLVCDVDPAVFDALRDPGPDSLELLALAAQAHDVTLARFVDAPVLPLRLGTVLHDDEAVIGLLGAHEQRLHAELRRIAEHAEWAVTVHAAEPLGDETAPPDATSGRAYLEGRRTALHAQEDRWQDQQRLADAVHAPLVAAATDAAEVTSRPLEDHPPTFHGVYLVGDEARDRFLSTVSYLRGEHPDAVIEVTGPWPPYHFSAVDLSDDDPDTP
jgi:hypothetical protein